MSLLNWSLKFHSSLWTIPHLIFTHNTQDFVQLMLISFVWLYMFKCDVYAQLLVDQTQKDFLVFYMFLKVILYFRVFCFLSKCIFVFFSKNWFRGSFARSSQLRASRGSCLREIIFFFVNSYKGYHDLFVTNNFLRKLLSFNGHSRDCLATA